MIRTFLTAMMVLMAAVAGATTPTNCDVDATACWQAALDAARPSDTAPMFFGVDADPRVYRVTDTLRVHGTIGGVIDGHGAVLEWHGPPDRPMWLATNTQQLRWTNLRIRVVRPLQAAFEFAKAPYTEANVNLHVAPSQNRLDSVRIDAVGLNDLQFGVRFSSRYGIDQDNDQSLIEGVTISNVTQAAISLEHSQSQFHHFVAVRASGAPGAPSSAFVRTTGGSFTVNGGTRTQFSSAIYDLGSVYGNVLVLNDNSEASARLIKTPQGAAGFSFPVQFVGGRFALDGLAGDGRWADFHRFGPLSFDGFRLDGTPPEGVTPRLYYWPWPPAGNASGRLSVRNMNLAFKNSAAYPVVILSPYAKLLSEGHLCQDGNGGPAVCAGLEGRR